MRAAIYARISTKSGDSDRRHQTNENQLPLLREYCQREGYEIAGEYCDEMTGTTMQRPAFRRMMDDAKSQKFGIVVFFALDRLSRGGALETLKTLETLKSWGCAWASITEPYLSSIGPFADAVIAILAVIAKQESIRRSERALAAIARVRRAGGKLGRNKRVFPRDKVAALAAEGLSVDGITKALREVGHKVSRSTVHREIQRGKK